MKYNEDIWSDLTWEEKQIYYIYEAFQKRTSKKGSRIKWLSQATSKSSYDYDRDGKYPGDKIRESKNWKYFCDVWEIFKDSASFDPEIFMDSVFRHLPKEKNIAPAQLRTKKIIQQYKDYRMKLKMSDNISDEKQMMRDIINTYKFIQRKLNKDELSQSDIYNFFNSVKDSNVISLGLFSCINEMISPFYMAVSKSFEDAYVSSDEDIREEIMPFEKYQKLRALVTMKTRVYQFAKKVFGKDII